MASKKADTRRRYSMMTMGPAVAQCAEPGALMAHGINANIVHRWRRLVRGGAVKTVSKTGEVIALPLTMTLHPSAIHRPGPGGVGLTGRTAP